jgi:hypothetical protein
MCTTVSNRPVELKPIAALVISTGILQDEQRIIENGRGFLEIDRGPAQTSTAPPGSATASLDALASRSVRISDVHIATWSASTSARLRGKLHAGRSLIALYAAVAAKHHTLPGRGRDPVARLRTPTST